MTAAMPLETLHAVEAEQALLGAILMNNDGVGTVSGFLAPEHFFEPVHARIYNAVRQGVAAGQKISPVTLAPFFRDDPSLAQIGGPAYLARLAASATTIINAPEYAALIVDMWARRQARAELAKLDEALHNPSYDEGKRVSAPELIRESLAAIAELGEVTGRKAREAAGRVGERIITEINDHFQGIAAEREGAPTGLATLRRIMHTWEEQALVLIAGRPSMGKTTVGSSFMLAAAEQGANVLFFSLEMSRKQLTQRMLTDLDFHSAGTAIAYDDVRKRQITEEQFQRLMDASAKLKLLPITIDDRAGLTVEQMRSTATLENQRLEALKKKLDIVIVDHGGLIGSTGRRDNRVNEIEDITAGLKNMAKALRCCVVCLVQLSRGTEARENKRPTLSDLRGSGSWEQDADVVMFLYREEYYLERMKEDDPVKEMKRQQKLNEVRGKLELIVAKNRMGACGTWDMMVHIPSGAVRDLEVDRG